MIVEIDEDIGDLLCRRVYVMSKHLLQTVVETPAFLGDARSLGLTDAERPDIPVFLLNIFAKTEKTDLAPKG